ncbi:MPN337 family protein, partial [Mycoplasmoides pirum]
MKHVAFLNELKIRNTYSFYISNLNQIFFDLNSYKYKNNLFYKRLISDLKKDQKKINIDELLNIEKISHHETFQNLLNKIVVKINSLLGDKDNPAFVFEQRNEWGVPIYVTEEKDYSDLKILGDKSSQKRYMFQININPNSYLFSYVDQIQIFFCIDDKNKIVSGAFSLNQGINSELTNSKETLSEKIFLNNLYRYFLENEFKKISIGGLLELFEDLKFIKNNSKLSYESKLKNNWKDYISKKFLNDLTYNIDSKFYKDDLFNSIFIFQAIILVIYDEIKSYFTNPKPEILLKKFNAYNEINNIKENSNSDRDLMNMIVFLKNKHSYFPEINIDEVETANELFEAILDYSKFEDHSLWHSIPSYEIIRNSDIPFINENSDIFLNNDELKLFFLLTMYSNLFGMEITNTNFSSFNEVIKLASSINFNDSEIDENLKIQVKDIICEKNYDYITFINSSLSSLIIKNNNPINDKTSYDIDFLQDPNFNLSNNYLWATTYIQSRIWKSVTIDKLLDKVKNKEPWKLRNLIYEMNNLQIDSYDNFYGLPIKSIVQTMEQKLNLKDSISLLIKKLNRDDQRFGKNKERNYLSVGVLVATIFGVLDFFTTVFSILTVSNSTISESLKDPINISIITIGSIFAFVLLGIIILAIFSIFK